MKPDAKPREFPIMSQRGAKPHPTTIPWELADLAYSVYSARYGKDQSLERLAERGGFGPGEMDEFVPDWRERCDRIQSLEQENRELRREWESACERARPNHEVEMEYQRAILQLKLENERVKRVVKHSKEVGFKLAIKMLRSEDAKALSNWSHSRDLTFAPVELSDFLVTKWKALRAPGQGE